MRDDVASDSRATAASAGKRRCAPTSGFGMPGVVTLKRFPPDATANSAVYQRCGEVGYRSERSRTIARARHWSRVLALSGASGQDVQLELPVTPQNMSARLSNETTALRIDRAIPRRV